MRAIVVLPLACGGDTTRPADVIVPFPTDDGGDVGTSEDGDAGSEGEVSSGELESGEGEGEESGDATTTGAAETYPHIARVRVPDAWLHRDDGLWDPPFGQSSPFLAIGQAFYAEHPDAWDFLVVYTEGELVGGYALADTVAYDIAGIGLPAADWVHPADAGSAGRLQQINVMNTPQYYAFDPDVPDIVVHETAHRWSAFIELPGTPQQGWLLDDGYAHWNVHVETGGPSATGYGEVLDLGGGAFEYRANWPLQLSQLELYLAGLIAPEEVGAMFWVASPQNHQPAVSPLTGMPFAQRSYGEDVTYAGTRVDFSVDDVIASNGPRLPAFGDAQTHFRFAFVMVCFESDACPDGDLAIVEAQRVGFIAQLAAATGGRATADVSLDP